MLNEPGVKGGRVGGGISEGAKLGLGAGWKWFIAEALLTAIAVGIGVYFGLRDGFSP